MSSKNLPLSSISNLLLIILSWKKKNSNYVEFKKHSMDKFLDYNGDVILFHMNNICKLKEIGSFLNDYKLKEIGSFLNDYKLKEIGSFLNDYKFKI